MALTRSCVDLLRCSTSAALQTAIRTNAWRSALGRMGREPYLRRYPVTLIQPDGSSIEIRYTEPRNTVALAVDLKVLSDDERRQRLAARKPKAKRIVKEFIDDNFNEDEYTKFFTAGDSAQPTQSETAVRADSQKNAAKPTKPEKKAKVEKAGKPQKKAAKG